MEDLWGYFKTGSIQPQPIYTSLSKVNMFQDRVACSSAASSGVKLI